MHMEREMSFLHQRNLRVHRLIPRHRRDRNTGRRILFSGKGFFKLLAGLYLVGKFPEARKVWKYRHGTLKYPVLQMLHRVNR